MSLSLSLIRHGHAGNAARDSDRSLSRKGREVVRDVVEILAAREISFSYIVSSPLVRAVQTSEILAERLGHGSDVLIDRCLVPEAQPSGVLDFINAEGLHGNVALVAHEPILSGLAGHLVRAPFRALKKSEVITVEVPDGGEGPAEIAWWLDPKSLEMNVADS